MKKSNLFTFFSFLFVQLLFAQKTVSDDKPDTILQKTTLYNLEGVDVKPVFPGGLTAFYSYISRSYQTPQVKGLAGKVFTVFTIDIDGSIVDIKIIRELGHGTGEEAIRVLKESPKWSPGEKNGQKVKVLFSLPITIQTKK